MILMFAVAVAFSSTDIYIPSLPQMKHYFKTSDELVQFSVTATIMGMSIITLFLGQLADALGRRRVLVLFQGLFALFTFLSAFAPSIEIFNLLRVFTGISSISAFTVGVVVIGDLYNEEKAAIYYSYLTAAMLFAVIFAPYIGGIFTEMGRWQYSFFFLSALAGISTLSLWLFIPETLEKKKHFSISAIWQQNKSILSNSLFISYTFMYSLLIGGIMTFFTIAPFYYIDRLGLSAEEFARHIVFINSINLIAALSVNKLFVWLSILKSLLVSLGIVLAGACLFYLFSIFYFSTPILLTFAASLFVGGSSMGAIASFSIIMNALPEHRATVSSMSAFFRGGIMMVCISFGTIIYRGEAVQIAYPLLIFIFLSLSIYAWLMFKRK